MSASVHLIVPDLLLPTVWESATQLHLPALEKILARADSETLPPRTVESLLCSMFGVAGTAIAPILLEADGVAPGEAYWLRADPVHMQIERDRLILHPVSELQTAEAAQLCASLNAHFLAAGLNLVAPHPDRWYLRLDQAPEMVTHDLPAVIGRDVRDSLPYGKDALYWHGVLNEMQMLLYDHAVNQAREMRGEWPVNSVWLWGGGHAQHELLRPVQQVMTDDPLAAALAAAAGVAHASLPERLELARYDGVLLVVWEGMRQAIRRGDVAGWRAALERFERSCLQPALQALMRGRTDRITLDVLQPGYMRRHVLTRSRAWRFWRRAKLHSLVAGVE